MGDVRAVKESELEEADENLMKNLLQLFIKIVQFVQGVVCYYLG